MWTEAFIQSDEEEDFSTSSSAFHEAVLELLQKVGPDGATHAFDHFSITAAIRRPFRRPSELPILPSAPELQALLLPEGEEHGRLLFYAWHELVIVGQEWVSHRIGMEPQTPCSPGDRAPQLLLRGNSLILDVDHSPVAASGAAGAATCLFDPEKMIGAGAKTAISRGVGYHASFASACLGPVEKDSTAGQPTTQYPFTHYPFALCLFALCPFTVCPFALCPFIPSHMHSPIEFGCVRARVANGGAHCT